MPETADLLTTAEVAAELGITNGAVRKLASVGKLCPASDRWRGRLLLFTPEEVARYTRERRPRGNPGIGELRKDRAGKGMSDG